MEVCPVYVDFNLFNSRRNCRKLKNPTTSIPSLTIRALLPVIFGVIEAVSADIFLFFRFFPVLHSVSSLNSRVSISPNLREKLSHTSSP